MEEIKFIYLGKRKMIRTNTCTAFLDVDEDDSLYEYKEYISIDGSIFIKVDFINVKEFESAFYVINLNNPLNFFETINFIKESNISYDTTQVIHSLKKFSKENI